MFIGMYWVKEALIRCHMGRKPRRSRTSVAPQLQTAKDLKLPELRRASNALDKLATTVNASAAIKRYRQLHANTSFRSMLASLDDRLQQYRTRRFVKTASASKRAAAKSKTDTPNTAEKLLTDLARVKRKLGGKEQYMTEKQLVAALGPEGTPELAMEILHFFGEEPPATARRGSQDFADAEGESIRREQHALREEMAKVSVTRMKLQVLRHTIVICTCYRCQVPWQI